MVKIKRKVEMTCGEFAKYMVDKFGFSSYEIKLSDGYWVGNPEREYDVSIHLPASKVSDLPDITITKSGVVIFEVEEEINRETEFEHLIEVTKDELHIHWSDSSIAGQLMPVSKEFHAYIDGEYKLIWTEENGLVE